MSPALTLRIRQLGTQDYVAVWDAMRRWTAQRRADTPDEIWILEHPAVFTLGLNGDPRNLLNPGTIPVVPTDRGGQVTYHGPGQLVVYTLLDLRRLNLGVRPLVSALEQSVIRVLAMYGVRAVSRRDAPGVYVEGAKIAALGLRVRHGCSYHGFAVNVSCDLAPFAAINPCGFPELKTTSLLAQGVAVTAEEVAVPIAHVVADILGYFDLAPAPLTDEQEA